MMTVTLRSGKELDQYIAYFLARSQAQPLISGQQALLAPLQTVQRHFGLTARILEQTGQLGCQGTIQQTGLGTYTLTYDSAIRQNSTRAIVCVHELAHVWLDQHAPTHRQDFPNTRCRERLTDVVSILLGGGILSISGFKRTATRVIGLGYLSIAEKAYVLARYEHDFNQTVDSKLIPHREGRTKLAQARLLCQHRHTLTKRTLGHLHFACVNAGIFRVKLSLRALKLRCPFCQSSLRLRASLWTHPLWPTSYQLRSYDAYK